ncbi:VOC family protein [Dyadobacter sandarakinus]|uniref:VOC family protein n=1 Tax=Dyadobacter sandarakinus TaxID=2747268 RepID=A0ABX7I417_9BACT|nr:VOC family protein [Dyadobacter sandarakinus]QRR00478.1 VOC family protein [Dyadobacter sandarakinus]
MFKNAKAFTGYSVNDLQKAKDFYGNILQLDVSEIAEMPTLRLHLAGGGDVLIYEKPNHQPATFTVLNFPVEDLEGTVAKLKELGVPFEDYDFPGLKTDADHIARGPVGPHIAWFTDPAGNILSVLKEM